MPPEPVRAGRMAGAAAAAFAAFFAILVIGGLAAAFILSAAESRASATAEREAAAGAGSVGAALQAQIVQALDYGIPLEDLPGIADVFDATLRQVPSLSAIALRAGPVDVAAGVVPAGVSPLSFPIVSTVAGDVGTLEVWAAGDPARAALGPLQGQAALIVLAAALLGAGAAWLAARGALARPAAEIGAALDTIAAGTFAAAPVGPGRGPVARARRAVAALVERVSAQDRQLRFVADEQRELDFDGSLTRAVDQTLVPVAARWRFLADDAAPTGVARRSGGWVAGAGAAIAGALWLVSLLSDGLAGGGPMLELAPGFALDRPLVALLGAALALFLLGPLARRRPRLLAGGGFVAAALALVAPRLLAAAEVGAVWPLSVAAIVAGAGLAAALAASWAAAGLARPAAGFLAAFGVIGTALGAAAAATLGRDVPALAAAVVLAILALVSIVRRVDGPPPARPASACLPLLAAAGAVPLGLALSIAGGAPGLDRVVGFGVLAVAAGACAAVAALRVLPPLLSVAAALVALAAVYPAMAGDPAAIAVAALFAGFAAGVPAADGDGDRAAAGLAGVAAGVLAPALAGWIGWPAWQTAALLLGVPALLGLACSWPRRARGAA